MVLEMRMNGAKLVILALLLGSPALFSQTAPKSDPIEALAGKWDVRCSQKGCLMFTDVLIGDPDHPADLKHPQYITIAVAINRSDRKLAWIDFDLPPDADRSQGFYIAFANATKNGKSWKLIPDKSTLSHLNFFKCDDESCIGRASGGLMTPSENGSNVDLLQEFLKADQIWFLFSKNGQRYRTMKALFPFQRAYKQLMETELQPGSK